MITTRFFSDLNLLLVHMFEQIDMEQLLEHNKKATQIEGINPLTLRIFTIIDAGTDGSSLTAEHLRHFASVSPPELPDLTNVVLPRDDLAFGLSRMFAVLGTDEMRSTVEKTDEKARIALRLSETEYQHILETTAAGN